MARILQTRDPELSLFQSAIEEVVLKSQVAGGGQSLGDAMTSPDRPGVEDGMVRDTSLFAASYEKQLLSGNSGLPEIRSTTGPVTEDIGGTIKYCGGLAFGLAKSIATFNTSQADRYRAELTAKFGSCDPRYVEAAEQAALYFKAKEGSIPYVDWKEPSDFVLEDGKIPLPSNAKIAVIGDWGTGQPQAKAVLSALAQKDPDIVIHLGDVYYSGTEPETENYFFKNWCEILNLAVDKKNQVSTRRPATFSLAGNHDMYSGGVPYYKMIRQLGQEASFFCLRNADWQFIGLDTGFNDHLLSGPATKLPPRQAEWLKEKIENAGNRKTILFSHHQLFSNEETFSVDGKAPGSHLNVNLMADVEGILDSVSLWIWGHQHQLVAYTDGPVRARCLGHGGYPVGLSEIQPYPFASLPYAIDLNLLQPRGGAFYDNGYCVIELDGLSAETTYYSVDENGIERQKSFTETIV